MSFFPLKFVHFFSFKIASQVPFVLTTFSWIHSPSAVGGEQETRAERTWALKDQDPHPPSCVSLGDSQPSL